MYKRKRPLTSVVDVETNSSKLQRMGEIAVKALQTANTIRQFVNSEMHYHDTEQVSSYAEDWDGTRFSLVDPATGDTDSTRTGDSILVKEIEVRGSFVYDSTLGGNQYGRVIIALDKDNKVTVSNLLEIVGSAGTTFSPKKHDYRFCTRVLYDKQFVVNSQFPVRLFSFKKKFKKLIHTQFIADGTSILRNDLAMFTYTDVDDTSGNKPAFVWHSRVRYHDN